MFTSILNIFVNLIKQFFSKISPAKANQNDFAQIASKWWETSTVLLRMNQVRIPIIKDGILAVKESKRVPGQKVNPSKPLEGVSMLDIGSGVGFLCEPLARLGAKMTGIDPEPVNIQVANEHVASDKEARPNITYVCGMSDDLLIEGLKFDAVVASEVIEHVDDPEGFVNTAVELTKDNGSLFFTTINRTVLSYLVAIFAFEFILKIIPLGMHSWNMFIKPEDLETWLKSRGCVVQGIYGYCYNPLKKNYFYTSRPSIFYAVHAVKSGTKIK